MVLPASPYNSFDNYTVVNFFYRSSTLIFSNMHSFWKTVIQRRSPMLGEHESGLSQSLRRPIPPVLSLLGPIFLSDTWVTFSDPAWRPREKACSAHLAMGPAPQTRSLGILRASFGIETNAPGFL